MFSHIHLGTRDCERALAFCRRTGRLLAALAAFGVWSQAQAFSEVMQVGMLNFAPGATALVAEQRQALDRWTPRRQPPCAVLAVRRSGGPVTALTALEAARVAYVTQLFSMRGVTVLDVGIHWRRPDEVVEPAWVHAVIWGEARCPGVPMPSADGSPPPP